MSDCPDDLPNLIRFILKRVSHDAVEELTGTVVDWVRQHPRLGRDYAWPGNFRELEQCVWNVLIRQEYHPPADAMPDDPRRRLADAVVECQLSADALERDYYTLVFAQTGSYQETSRRLGRNWRTVKSKIDRALLQQMQRKADIPS